MTEEDHRAFPSGASDQTLPMTAVDDAPDAAGATMADPVPAVASASAPPPPPAPAVPPKPATGSTLSVDTTQGRRAVEERMESLVGREQQAKFRRRVMSTARIGAGLWSMFVVLDAIALWRGMGRWEVYALARLIPLLIAGIVYAYLKVRRDASVLSLRMLELLLFPSAAICTTVMVAQTGGWLSPRLPMVSLLVLGHAILLGTAWRRSIIPVAAMTLSVPLTLAVLSTVWPEMAAQLADPTMPLEFASVYGPIVGAAIISLIAGNTVYQLRMELMEAKSIGRYRLRRRIAQGGMGEIWAAYHAGLKRDVAVKLMQPRFGEDETAVRRFEREVRAMAELTHPNTVRVFDYGATEAGVWYYAMELLEAQDLQSIVETDGPLAVPRAVRLVCQAADALGEAHQRGIVHRDVKPANLLVANAGRKDEFVKVIDFGIAKIEDADGLTSTGMVIGTPGYIAPEVASGGEASPRADVYALAMVLYMILAGDVPHQGSTPMAILKRTVEADPPALRAVRSDVPPMVEAVVMQALARDPARRPATAGDLADALREAFEY